MSRIITEYLNEIQKYIKYDDTIEWTFVGDGQGDFEECGNDVTEEVLYKYKAYCQQQIDLADEVLRNTKKQISYN